MSAKRGEKERQEKPRWTFGPEEGPVHIVDGVIRGTPAIRPVPAPPRPPRS